MKFVYRPSINDCDEDAWDLIDKDNGNLTVACDVTEEYQLLLLAAPELLEACELLLMCSLPNDVSGRAMVDKALAAVALAKPQIERERGMGCTISQST